MYMGVNDVRQTEIQTAEPLVPESSAFEVELAVEKLKSHKSQGVDHIPAELINLLKPTGYMMHHQFNIQQLYALPTLYLYVLYLYENKQRLVPLTA